jgi:hypothetical protein
MSDSQLNSGKFYRIFLLRIPLMQRPLCGHASCAVRLARSKLLEVGWSAGRLVLKAYFISQDPEGWKRQ